MRERRKWQRQCQESSRSVGDTVTNEPSSLSLSRAVVFTVVVDELRKKDVLRPENATKVDPNKKPVLIHLRGHTPSL